jgi:hypothetical protein
MNKFTLALLIIITTSSGHLVAQESGKNIVVTSANPELCGDLLDSAEENALNHREMGIKAAEQVTGGDGDLKDESCFADVMDADFDFFSGIPTWHTVAINEIKDRALEKLRNLACDAAESVNSAIDTLSQCSASLGLNLNAGVGDITLPSVEECGGLTADYQFDVGNDQPNNIFDESTGAETRTGNSASSTGGSISNEYF